MCPNDQIFKTIIFSGGQGFIKSVKANIFNCASCQLPPILPQCACMPPGVFLLCPKIKVNKVHLEPGCVTLGRSCVHCSPSYSLFFFAMTFFAGGQPQKILCPCKADLKWHTWMRQPRTDCSDITIIASGHWVVVWRVPYLMIIMIIMMTLMIMRTMRTKIPKFKLWFLWYGSGNDNQHAPDRVLSLKREARRKICK